MNPVLLSHFATKKTFDKQDRRKSKQGRGTELFRGVTVSWPTLDPTQQGNGSTVTKREGLEC